MAGAEERSGGPSGESEAIWTAEVEGDVVLRGSVGMKTSELAKAEGLAIEHKELITTKVARIL